MKIKLFPIGSVLENRGYTFSTPLALGHVEDRWVTQRRLAGDWGQPAECAQGTTKEDIFFFSSAVFLASHIYTPLQMHILMSLLLKRANKALSNFPTNIEQLHILS